MVFMSKMVIFVNSFVAFVMVFTQKRVIFRENGFSKFRCSRVVAVRRLSRKVAEVMFLTLYPCGVYIGFSQSFVFWVSNSNARP